MPYSEGLRRRRAYEVSIRMGSLQSSPYRDLKASKFANTLVRLLVPGISCRAKRLRVDEAALVLDGY